MKNGKRLTLRQKELLKSKGLNPADWLVVKNVTDELHLLHRKKGRVRVINV